ncbi:MAG TPA: gliding motility-associated C-terminal domain-containing protein [Cyclobacteriaceae bacterium]|nr:gliding motility-associated C-terminal domain-containing protein [Cyclobacteriaceae bacterium]
MVILAVSAAAPALAQIDTEFWFAPPEASRGHGDQPPLIRFASQDKPTTVEISLPARGMVLATFSMPAFSAHTVNLANNLADLETIIPDAVMKTGLKITATEPVTAYYEIFSYFNGEIFSLKGRNAIGNKFIVPGQNVYDISADYTPAPAGSIDIVATKDNTRIRVKPTTKFVGHESMEEFFISLNMGETYSLRQTSILAAATFAGTVLESNKPIAVTFKDDSLVKNTCRDIVGDQTLPVKVTGTEYIVPKGFLSSPEYVFITATEDNTPIYMSGGINPMATLNAGQTFRLNLTWPATYITSTKRIYVFHITGFICELGGAVLPPVTCTGSKRVTFTRSTEDFFGMDIIVRKEGIGSFTLNNSAGLIPRDSFQPVMGTNDEWYSAQLSFSTLQVAPGEASVVSNDNHSFQVGIINGSGSNTAKYGYFSSFATLFIGDDVNMCEGDVQTIDAGPGKGSYKWSTGSTLQSIDVTTAGKYWVTITSQDCILSDTVNVVVKPKRGDLGPDLQICPFGKAKMDGQANASWLWSNGSTDRYLEVELPGKYGVKVIDYNGCVSTDTVEVTTYVDRFNESVQLRLDYVSVDTAAQENIDVDWTKNNGNQPEDLTLKLFKRPATSTAWEEMLTTSDEHGPYVSTGNQTALDSYEWYGVLVNLCGDEKLESVVHETMLLRGVADTVNGNVKLEWSDYVGWPHRVDRYEVWRKLDEGKFEMVAATGALSYTSNLAFDGFTHEYVIRAYEADGTGASWSNITGFHFEHPLYPYNVFTPNGDSFNEKFIIRNIHLYKNAHLIVMNRWGQRVFEDMAYKNTWDGGDSPAGVYYYVIDAGNGAPELRGVVSLVR